MAGKWFDFGETADVRLRAGKDGAYHVHISLKAEPIKEQLARVYEANWKWVKKDGPYEFRHGGPVASLSEVAARLEAFFPKEKIMAALTATEAPAPEPDVEEVAPVVNVEALLATYSAETPTALIEHVRHSIERAKSITGARQSAAKQLPFGGDGWGVFNRLAERTDAETAAFWFGTVLAALSEQDDEWERLLDELMDADATNSTSVPRPHELVVEHVRQMSNFYKGVEIAGLCTKSQTEALFAQVVEDFGGNVGYRAFDGALIRPTGAPDLAKNSFTAQAGVTQAVATDAKARLTSALTASGRAFGISRDRLFGDNEVKFMLGTAINRRNPMVAGQAREYRLGRKAGDGTTKTVNLYSIHLTPNSPGALIHEIGHQIHKAGKEAEILEAVKSHPFAHSTRRIVSMMEDKGLCDPNHAEYLMSPPEIFARAFDAQVFAKAGAAAAGGAFGTLGVHPITPVGEELDAFMTSMKAVVLEARAEAKADAGEDEEFYARQSRAVGM